VKRLWIWLLGAVVAVGLVGPAGAAEARTLSSHGASHHGVRRAHLVSRTIPQPAPRPAPSRPAHDRSNHRAAMPQLTHSSHHRAGPKSWDQNALGGPSQNLRHSDPGFRLSRESGFVIRSQEHPVISGRGPPSVLLTQTEHRPAPPHHALLIPLSLDPETTAAGPSRDPGFIHSTRASAPAFSFARVPMWSFGHKGLSHGLCHPANRPKGADAGHDEPFIGGVS
jgi:hypothetical protein